ncbi:MAG: excinuclease Cho [Burkholderiales bacterium]|nr:excinuclease Cho [Burkholderiales bacterium]
MRTADTHLNLLRQQVRAAPAAPGVYTFYGERQDLPLYIGKSVNLRSRLLSHLRDPGEARMLAQARRIHCVRTAGEIGALLLEARMVKQKLPLFNQKLRRNRALCSLRWTGEQPEVVDTRSVDFAREDHLYGIFATRQSAVQKLRDLADEHRLCWGLLGLEKLVPGRPCFRSMIGRCAGACKGSQGRDEHRRKLLAALEHMQLRCWPYEGAVGLMESGGDLEQIHVVRNWCYLGSAASLDEARELSRVAAGFDADGYKILVGPILSGSARVVEIS